MSSMLKNKVEEFTIFQTMECHPTWHESIPGLVAEKKLRGLKTPYVYLLRKGEPSTNSNEEHYYVTFTLPDGSVKHQPLILTVEAAGWCFENTQPGGPYKNTSIDDVLHLIMHCQKGECVPFVKR